MWTVNRGQHDKFLTVQSKIRYSICINLICSLSVLNQNMMNFGGIYSPKSYCHINSVNSAPLSKWKCHVPFLKLGPRLWHLVGMEFVGTHFHVVNTMAEPHNTNLASWPFPSYLSVNITGFFWPLIWKWQLTVCTVRRDLINQKFAQFSAQEIRKWTTNHVY